MREIKIDFSKGYPTFSTKEAGFIGEVNATNVTIIPPEYMTNDERISKYYVKFQTNKGVVYSESFGTNTTIKVSLCHQLTTGEYLALQLVGEDDEKQIVVKSSVIYLLLSQGINEDGKIINQDEMPSEGKIIQLVSVEVKSDTDDEYILTITTKDGSFDTPNLVGKRGEQGEQGISGVYVGSDEMPDGYNIQINPNGTTDSSVPILTVKDEDNNIIPISAIQGSKGDDGKSAYESAVEGGYAESESVFYQQLANIGTQSSDSLPPDVIAAQTVVALLQNSKTYVSFESPDVASTDSSNFASNSYFLKTIDGITLIYVPSETGTLTYTDVINFETVSMRVTAGMIYEFYAEYDTNHPSGLGEMKYNYYFGSSILAFFKSKLNEV